MSEPAPPPEDAIFTRRTAAWLLGLSAASLAITLVLLAFSGQMSAGDSAQANAFSRSSIGYRALIELLETAGVDVVVSRFRSAQKAGPGAPLLLAEPAQLDPPQRDKPVDDTDSTRDDDEGPRADADADAGAEDEAEILRAQHLAAQVKDAEARGAAVVVVLPKHWGNPGDSRDGWIDALDADGEPEKALQILAGPDCFLSDAEPPRTWSSALPGGELPALPFAAPQAPQADKDAGPAEPLAPQLIADDCPLERLVWSDAGVLVGAIPDSDVYVVSDPDLLNTWGLAHGDNAVIAHRLFVEELGATSLVVDEVTHGFYQPPSIWTELLTLPLLPVTLHVLGLTLLAIAAAALRLGKPVPTPPRVPPGKRALVDSTAELLDGGGHHAESVRHYLRMTLRHTAAALGLPPGDDPLPALSALGRARGASSDIALIAREIDALPQRGPRVAPSALALAGAIDAWRKEILDEHR